ncbi:MULTISPECIES: DNA-binding protein [unclassified Variovorax]|uniref:DNA-binding protein n=1 Tax=unclassified Variovorax TaxID=663243 RepID=UPI0008BE8CAF|nr:MULTISPECIES: DNA-binding protein [unclassified Variovorax]SEK16580.1 replication region DNA-binding N-term [Variovorax sp. OK202]SFE53171.1 replication region DNA-binding N-term [Variovorax sp. OK212]
MEMDSSRGITQAQVWGAADAILIEGQRPTIERIRQRLGRGSPNTVGPMVERWFATLGKRLGNGLNGPGAASNDEAGQQVPLPILCAATQLWQSARAEADQSLRQESEAGRRQLELEEALLQEAAAALRTREQAFESNRSQLEAALASSQHAVTTLREQLEAASQRAAAVDQVAEKLRKQLDDAGTQRDRLKEEHAAALVARDRLALEAEERHIANERRLLAEVDRSREETKRTAQAALQSATRDQAALAKSAEQLSAVRDQLAEEQRAARTESATAKAETVAARAAATDASNAQASAEQQLREQTGTLTLAHAELGHALARLQEMHALHARETEAHEATRQMLQRAMGTAAPPKASVNAISAPARSPRKR